MMATTPNDDLLAKVQQLNRFRTGQYARGAGAAVGGFGARRAGGPAAGDAFTDRMFYRPDPAGLTEAEAIAEKRRLLSGMSDAELERDKLGLDREKVASAERAALAKAKGGGKHPMELYIEMLKGRWQANSPVAVSLNSELTEIGKAKADAFRAAVTGGSGSGSGSASRALSWMEENQGSALNSWNKPALSRALAEKLRQSSPQERAEYLATIVGMMGGESDAWLAKMAALAEAGDPAASQVLGYVQSGDEAIKIQAGLIQEDTERFLGEKLEKKLSKGVAGPFDPADYEKFLKAYNAGDMAAAAQVVSDAAGKKGGGVAGSGAAAAAGAEAGQQPAERPPSVVLEASMKLLDSISADTPLPAGLAEARRRFIADPSFQDWMKENDFPPGSESYALRILRRRTADKVYAAKQTARKVEQSRRDSGTQESKVQPPGSTAPGGDIGAASKAGTATSAGATPDIQIEDLELDPGDVAAVKDAASTPPPAQPAEQAPAPVAPAPVMGQAKLPTLGMATHAISNTVLRPGRTYDKGAALIRTALQKRLNGEPDAPAPGLSVVPDAVEGEMPDEETEAERRKRLIENGGMR